MDRGGRGPASGELGWRERMDGGVSGGPQSQAAERWGAGW